VVVSNTTPLNYLILIEAADLLPKLYGRVLIPFAVRDELNQHRAPQKVRRWAINVPDWLEIDAIGSPTAIAISHLHLDPGEREAISLALERQADFLLMDERDGVLAARKLDLRVVGTLGVLDLASSRELLDLPEAFGGLRQTSFRLPERLAALMLEHDRQRRRTET
jgi:predicted nucleic acid-binding protein